MPARNAKSDVVMDFLIRASRTSCPSSCSALLLCCEMGRETGLTMLVQDGLISQKVKLQFKVLDESVSHRYSLKSIDLIH
jgi:hypothetical protein